MENVWHAIPAEQEEQLLLIRDRDGVRTLVLNAPQNRNALSSAMMARLQQVFDDSARDPQVRVIVIAGNGPAFCAGHDLRELDSARHEADGGRSALERLMRQCSTLMQTIVGHPRPVIADIRGMASAAGCQLVASCDLALAAETARFATPGVNIGLFCSTPMVALSRKVGRKHAMEMLLTGDPVDAATAFRFGLVNRVVPMEQMDGQIADLTARIAAKSLMTLRTGKQAFYRQADLPLDRAYEYTVDVMVDNMLRKDAREGVSAFLEKRAPSWKDE